MKDNTQEKNLIERNEENIFIKIKNFFKGLFRKKGEEVNKTVNEDIEIDENNIFELQRRYRKGEIADSELTQEQINALCQLYDSQIADLKRNISAKEQQLAKYKKK